MKAAAYCRVSTNKDEQLDSMESQQKFFMEYAKKNGHELAKIYADEGKSGPKIKNRTQLIKLLSDAKKDMFDLVLIKDVSRLARNTVDFLTTIRKLKSLHVKVIFVNFDQTSSDSSEFMLTMLSAVAQEESANTSKRVKFGKKMNAEKGRVPNFVYGYDKIREDYFNLNINKNEAAVVRRIFDMYVNENMGTNKIAMELNSQGIKTKRNCNWSQNAVSRILSNKIYIGKIINGKEEVADFLTGKRKEKAEDDWMVTERQEFRLISDDIFQKAQRILSSRTAAFRMTGERNSEKHVFSKMIRCKCCGASFRRQTRQYKNTYTRWICTGRNMSGTDSCPNKTAIDEDDLLTMVKDYAASILKDRPNSMQRIINEFSRRYRAKDENEISEKELNDQLNRARKSKEKYMEMYEAEVVALDELREMFKQVNETISFLKHELKRVKMEVSMSDMLENVMGETFKDIESVLSIENMSNNMLGKMIGNIVADRNGDIEIYMKQLCDTALENNVLL